MSPVIYVRYEPRAKAKQDDNRDQPHNAPPPTFYSVCQARDNLSQGGSILRQDDFNKSQLVLTGWRWGREYGGHLAACLIMSCLANRVRLGWGSWLEVLDRVPAYAAVAEMPTGTPAIWEPNFVRLLHEVEAIYDGSQDYAKGAVYWADLRRIETPFFCDKILKNLSEHPRIVDLNSLSLFR